MRLNEAEAKAYKEYFDWCDETARNLQFDIKTGSSSKEKLEATIGKLTSDISVGTSKVDDLTATIAGDDADLKAGTGVRAKETADFAAAEAELAQGVVFLPHASGYLQRDREKGILGAAVLAQIDTSSMNKMSQALSTSRHEW